ncbi:MAG TPA: zinc ribbon domain-containing protein [Chitinophagales bacterium]|nr:zinc ribbon domain-containing protein [Chitinophagales bacterium]
MNRNIFQIIYPFLDRLSLGKTLRTIIYWLWKISVVVYGIFALYLIFKILSTVDDFGPFLLGLVACILIVLAWWIIAQIFFYRADKVRQLPDSEFTVIPIVAQLLRLSGELLAAVIIIVGVVAVLIGGYLGIQYLDLLPYFRDATRSLGGNNSIVGLLLIVLLAVVYAFWCIVIFYFLAEIVSVGVTIAQNSIAIRQMLSSGVSLSKNAEQTIVEEEEPPMIEVKPKELHCPNCGSVVNEEDAFCMNCGNKLK